MKNFKKIILGLIVSAAALGFSAFTNPTKLSGNWYTLKGGIGNLLPNSSSAQDFSNYDSNSQQMAQPDCGGVINVCAAEFANGTDADPTDFSLKGN